MAEENERVQDPQYEKRKRKKEWDEDQEKRKELLKEKGADATKWYMDEPLAKSKARYVKQEKKAGKKKVVYGWDVFNQDSLYTAYKKRTQDLKLDKEEYQKQIEQGENREENLTDDKLQRLVDDIEKQ